MYIIINIDEVFTFDFIPFQCLISVNHYSFSRNIIVAMILSYYLIYHK